MRRLIAIPLLACLCAAGSAWAQSTSTLSQTEADPVIAWRDSTPVGTPNRGALVNGVQLPAEGVDYFTWDFPRAVSPSRGWRRWGTDDTIRALLRVLGEYRAAHPLAPRVGVADVSRRFGGTFGERFGGLGHASHQNGLDVDVIYPRRDGGEEVATNVEQIDRALSQELVDRFVAAGAQYVFVGPRTKLSGPRKVVQKLVFHDDHMHVRFRRGAR